MGQCALLLHCQSRAQPQYRPQDPHARLLPSPRGATTCTSRGALRLAQPGGGGGGGGGQRQVLSPDPGPQGGSGSGDGQGGLSGGRAERGRGGPGGAGGGGGGGGGALPAVHRGHGRHRRRLPALPMRLPGRPPLLVPPSVPPRSHTTHPRVHKSSGAGEQKGGKERLALLGECVGVLGGAETRVSPRVWGPAQRGRVRLRRPGWPVPGASRRGP